MEFAFINNGEKIIGYCFGVPVLNDTPPANDNFGDFDDAA